MGTIYRNGKFYGSFKEDQELPIVEAEKNNLLMSDGNEWIADSGVQLLNFKIPRTKTESVAGSFAGYYERPFKYIYEDYKKQTIDDSILKTVVRLNTNGKPFEINSSPTDEQLDYCQKMNYGRTGYSFSLDGTSRVNFNNADVDFSNNARFYNHGANISVEKDMSVLCTGGTFIMDTGSYSYEVVKKAYIPKELLDDPSSCPTLEECYADTTLRPYIRISFNSDGTPKGKIQGPFEYDDEWEYIQIYTQVGSNSSTAYTGQRHTHYHVQGSGEGAGGKWRNEKVAITTTPYNNPPSSNTYAVGSSDGFDSNIMYRPYLNMSGRGYLNINKGATIYSSDTSLLEMTGDSELIMRAKGSLWMDGDCHAYFGGTSLFYCADNSRAYFREGGKLTVERGGEMAVTQGAQVRFDGGCQYKIGEGYNIEAGKALVKIGEKFVGELGKSLVKIGNGAAIQLGSNSAFLGYMGSELNWNWDQWTDVESNTSSMFSGIFSMTPNDTPFKTWGIGSDQYAVRFGGGSIIETGGGYVPTIIKVSSYGGTNGPLKVLLEGSPFIQYTGKAHTEMHEGSIFVMRPTTYTQPWKDGNYGTQWKRPVAPYSNSPIFGMYEKSQFCMRGIWEEEGKEYIGSFYLSDENSIYFTEKQNFSTDYNTWPEIIKEKFLDSLEGMDRNIVEIIEIIEKEETISGVKKYSYLAKTKYTVTYSDTNWKPHPEKIAGSPVMEIIEDAEVRVTGQGQILVNDEGVTFGNASGSVTFSIEELTALKNLLNS